MASSTPSASQGTSSRLRQARSTFQKSSGFFSIELSLVQGLLAFSTVSKPGPALLVFSIRGRVWSCSPAWSSWKRSVAVVSTMCSWLRLLFFVAIKVLPQSHRFSSLSTLSYKMRHLFTRKASFQISHTTVVFIDNSINGIVKAKTWVPTLAKVGHVSSTD